MDRSQESPEPPRRRLRGAIPEAGGQCRLRRGALHEDGPGHQSQCGQPLTTFWGKNAWTRCASHLLGRHREPCHRPAIAIEGLEVGARQRQRGVQEEGLVKARIRDERGAEGWCPRSRLGTYPVVPKLRVQGQRGCPETPLPGGVAIRWRRGNRAALGRAREGADQGTADGCAPLPWRGRERRPACREVDWSADDIALDARLWELAEGNTASTDERFVACALLVGASEEAALSGGFVGIGRLAPDQEAGHGQTLGPDCPNACRNAQRESG
jgi:hypothetical protein